MKNLRFTIYDLRAPFQNGRRSRFIATRKSYIVYRKFAAITLPIVKE